MVISKDYVSKISKMKQEDATHTAPKMFRLKNLVVFENDISAEDRSLAESAGLTLYTWEGVI